VLTGNNSYGCSTAVDAGTLIVNGNQSAAAGATSVVAGATLGGAGTIDGDVSVADGATLSPGNLGGVPGSLRDLLYRQAAADVAYAAMTSAFNPRRLSSRLPTTMDLLTLALEKDSLREFARKLELSEEALRTARSRGRLSPVLAGCIAEDLQLDAERWIVLIATPSASKLGVDRHVLYRAFRH
jgi:hypothetical protein